MQSARIGYSMSHVQHGYNQTPVNMWEQTEDSTYDVFVDFEGDPGFKMGSGLSKQSAQIYKKSIYENYDNEARLEISTKKTARFTKGQDDWNVFVRHIPLVYDGSIVVVKMGRNNKCEHPFGEHWEIATEIIVSHIKLYNVNKVSDEEIHGVRITNTSIRNIRTDWIRAKNDKKDKIQLPQKVYGFYTRCVNLDIAQSIDYRNDKNKYSSLTAREILSEQNRFNDLCKEFESRL